MTTATKTPAPQPAPPPPPPTPPAQSHAPGVNIGGFRVHIVCKSRPVWRRLSLPLDWRVSVADERLEKTLPTLHTPEEYGEEARRDPLMLKPFGKGQYSAMSKEGRATLARRYVRHKQWVGSGPSKVITLIWLAVMIFALPGPAVASYYYNVYVLQTDLYDATVPLWFFFMVMFFFGTIVVGAGGWVVVHLIKYKFCHAKLIGFEQRASIYDLLYERKRKLDRILGVSVLNDDPEDGRLSVVSGRLFMRVPWLCYVDKVHKGNYYAGARNQAGVHKSEIHVQLPALTKVHDLEDPKEVFEFAPRRHEFTGNTATYQYQFLQMFVNIGMGLFKEQTKGKIKKFLRDYWVFILIALEFFYVLYLNGRSSTFTLEVIELIQRNAEVTAEINKVQ